MSEYVRAQVRLLPDMRDEFYIHHLHSWRGFFEILGPAERRGSDRISDRRGARARRRRPMLALGGAAQVRFAVLLIATVLVNPHGYVYDSIILMPAFLLLWDWAEQQPAGFALKLEWLLYFCYLAPLFAIVALVARVQLSVPALTTLIYATCRREGYKPIR